MSANTDAMDEFEELLNRTLWRPMETAPRDGSRILIWYPNDDDGETYKIVQWGPSPHPTGWSFRGGWLAEKEPIAWMPLPDPPYTDPFEDQLS